MPTALPDDIDLDVMARAIAGVDYIKLSPDNRVKIMQLCIDNERNVFLAEIDDKLQYVSEWYEKSKLWEGRLT